MLPLHWRMAELWTLQQKRALTKEEMNELAICLQGNAIHARKLAELYNLSLVAGMSDDKEWLHDICREIERLEFQYYRS